MPSPYKYYLKHMHKAAGYRATWDPATILHIGDIVKLESDGTTTKYSTLADVGIGLKISSNETRSSLDYTSHDKVDITTKAAGKLPSPGSGLNKADAGFTFNFKSADGVVFQIRNYKTNQIDNLAAIQAEILEKYESGEFDEDWLIVNKLIEAETATIIISNSSNAALDLKANASVDAAGLKLTDASLQFSVAREQGSTMKYITQSDITPLYQVMGVHHPFLGLGTPGLAKKSITDGKKQLEFSVQDVIDKETIE